MPTSVSDQLDHLPSTTPSRNGGTGSATNTGVVPPWLRSTQPAARDQLMVVPAGIFGDILGSLAGTIGEVTGGYFGHKELGRTLGETAGPLIKHFSPFEVYAPSVAPQSTGPDSAPVAGPDEAVVVVPAGFLSGLLGGVGGGLLGGVVGGMFGNKKLGSDIGSGVGGAIGSVFGPFSIAPAPVEPAGDGAPGADPAPTEAMVVVPAGFFGNLIGAAAGSIGNLVAGRRGQQVGEIAGHLAQQLIPWSAVPPELAPQSAGPDGAAKADDLVVVPASWLSGLLKNYGQVLCSLPGNRLTGLAPTDKAGTTIAAKDITPFAAVPDALAPASADGTPVAAEDKLMLVPAGLFGSLLSSLGGTLGGAVGGLFGNAQAGQAVGNVVGQLGQFVPFTVSPSGRVEG